MTDYVEALYGLLLLALVAIVEVFRYRAAKDSQERASLSPDDQSRLLRAEDQVAATKKAAKQSTQALANLRKKFRRRRKFGRRTT